jgi:hypothetical protein
MGLPTTFFTSQEVHEREVTLADGSKHVLYFKELPAIEFRKFQMAETSDDEDTRAASVAKLIAVSLVEKDGKPAITAKQAAQLKGAAANALMSAILDVNGFGSKND